MTTRGELYWFDLGQVRGSEPAKRRPVLVVQSDAYNRSRLATAVVAAVTGNLAVADHPGNVFLSAAASGLPRDSVVNVTQLVTVNKSDLQEFAGTVPTDLMQQVTEGLALVLASWIT